MVTNSFSRPSWSVNNLSPNGEKTDYASENTLGSEPVILSCEGNANFILEQNWFLNEIHSFIM